MKALVQKNSPGEHTAMTRRGGRQESKTRYNCRLNGSEQVAESKRLIKRDRLIEVPLAKEGEEEEEGEK